MNSPLISVVVPVYRVEDFLNEAVESIVNQTYRNLEILLVDDGSSDKCPQICDAWALKDKRIKVIHKPNGGLSDARNVGINESTGDFIAFVDSDDTIEQDMYKTLLEIMQQYDADVVCCDYRSFRDGVYSRKKNIFHKEKEFTIYREWTALKELLLWNLHCGAWNKLIKKSIIGNIRFCKGRLNEDVLFWFEIFQNKPFVVETNKVFYNYRMRGGGITHSNHKHMEDLLSNSFYMLDQTERKHLPISDEMKVYSCVANITYCRYCYRRNYYVNNLNFSNSIKLLQSNFVFFLLNKEVSIRNKIRLIAVLFQKIIK